jgi:repressor LexA
VGLNSKDHTSRDLRKLQTAGIIHLLEGETRAIVLLKYPEGFPAPGILRLPLLGVIHAGAPIPTLEHTTALDWLDVARNWVDDSEDLYVLEASGDSMIDALVNDGDILVMQQARVAANGDMVAVWLKPEHATTLKRFHRDNGCVTLKPENPKLPPLEYDARDVEIQGKVLAIIRRTTPFRRSRN